MSSAPRWDVEGRDWPNRAQSRFVAAGRLRWHVQVMGPEHKSAPTLLLLHGTGAATHSWSALAPMLALHFNVVAPDLPGHGFTAGRPTGGLTMRSVAQEVGKLLQVLDVQPHGIIGHSAGAAVAVRMAIDGVANPVAIVGLSAALLPFPGLAAKLFPTLARILFVNPFAPYLFARLGQTRGETARFLARSTGSRIDAENIAYYERLFAKPGHCAGAIKMMADWNLDALKRDLPRLRIPMLFVHGEADAAISLANARDAAAMIGQAQLTPLAGLGHLAHEEKPGDVAAIIEKFMGVR